MSTFREVSLITDFGVNDHYVSLLKATIYRTTAHARITDISHRVDTHDITQAAFFLDSSYAAFPPGTIHVICVYGYYAADFELIIVKKNGYYFIAPDNGVLSLIFDDLVLDQVHKIDFKEGGIDRLNQSISHAIACLDHGLTLTEIGPPKPDFNQKMILKPVVTKAQIRATIIHVDHFENVVINIKKQQFEKIRNGRQFKLYYKQTDPLTSIKTSYGEVEIGDVLCLFNTDDFLEIAVNMGKAASMLNLKRNETIQINFYD